jgi:2-polyprenyl-3-methyl-5-hydroxy-6-metoxy-1,4-benzoquinol methylase
LNPRPDAESLQLYYPEEYAPYIHNGSLQQRFQHVLRRLEATQIAKFLPRKASILEIGCATGDLLAALRNKGFQVTGVEPSLHASSLARERFRLNVHTGTVFSVPFREASFDAVIMRAVIEHLPSPTEALRAVRGMMRNDGHLFILTDNLECLEEKVWGEFWNGFDVPRHLYVFNYKTLSSLLEKTGFKIKKSRYSMVTNSWIMSLKFFLEGRFGKSRILNLVSLHNPILILLFLPLTVTQRLFKRTAKLQVVATRSGL